MLIETSGWIWLNSYERYFENLPNFTLIELHDLTCSISLHKSVLSSAGASRINASTTSGAMYSTEPTYERRHDNCQMFMPNW